MLERLWGCLAENFEVGARFLQVATECNPFGGAFVEGGLELVEFDAHLAQLGIVGLLIGLIQIL
jgi:hypothetical protein